MKKILVIMLFTASVFMYANNGKAVTNTVNGCYMCQVHDMYVRFEGKDSLNLQKKALDKFGCKVYAVMDYCNVNTSAGRYVIITGKVK